tara:strand:+ start:40 stop:294 length:255 start_codon:yes stop_codon:yes gene_type:complete
MGEQMNKADESNNKKWANVGTFSTYEEAKNAAVTYDGGTETIHLKIKRGVSSNKEVFRLKIWVKPEENPKSNKKKSRGKKNESN